LKFGTRLPPQPSDGPLTVADLRRTVQVAADSGLEFISLPDHVLGVDRAARPDWSGPYDLDSPVREVFVTAGFLAGAGALEIVPSVVVLPQRGTAVVAKQAAELDLLTGGRLRLGVGVGWNDVEYAALGASFTSRGRLFDEQLQVLRLLWTRRSVYFDGQFHHLDGVGLWPLPVQRPIPLWLSGGPRSETDRPGERVLARAGRVADGWISRPVDQPAAVARAVALIRREAESSGRDPACIGIQVTIRVAGPGELPGVSSRVDAMRSAGASHVSFDTGRADATPARQWELLERLGGIARQWTSEGRG
jgi:probable F420-dependent oxidoreductase